MSSMQQIEIDKYHNEIIHDVNNLIEKYRKAMDWDIPENNKVESDRLIFDAVQKALNDML